MARSSSKSGLFLIELIIAIAFFAFASAICIQLFAKAHTLSATSTGMTRAIAESQSAAACFKATDASLEEMAALLDGEIEENILTVTYDKDWQTVGESRYFMTVVLSEEVPASAWIMVEDAENGEVLHQLTVKKYLG